MEWLFVVYFCSALLLPEHCTLETADRTIPVLVAQDIETCAITGGIAFSEMEFEDRPEMIVTRCENLPHFKLRLAIQTHQRWLNRVLIEAGRLGPGERI